jgi:16S rRNA (adenine1518-N6/adenine1519-N6)-dimethyltransferase
VSGTGDVPTLPRIRAALEARGLRPDRRFGQNFLTDARLLGQLVDAAEVGPGDAVVEVGPGPGTLTAVLLARGVHVIAVEVDARMVEVLHDLLGSPERLTVVCEDALAGPGALPPGAQAALDRLPGRPAAGGARAWTLVANLPYAVASTLLVDLFWADAPPRRACVTVQREVAERMVARPGTRAYGPMGVLLQLAAAVEVLRRLPPGAFWPRPRVESACVRLAPAARPAGVDFALLRDVVRAAFHGRRKRLANSLEIAFRGRLERRDLERLLHEKNLGPNTRGELLAPMELAELARGLAPFVRGPSSGAESRPDR